MGARAQGSDSGPTTGSPCSPGEAEASRWGRGAHPRDESMTARCRAGAIVGGGGIVRQKLTRLQAAAAGQAEAPPPAAPMTMCCLTLTSMSRLTSELRFGQRVVLARERHECRQTGFMGVTRLKRRGL